MYVFDWNCVSSDRWRVIWRFGFLINWCPLLVIHNLLLFNTSLVSVSHLFLFFLIFFAVVFIHACQLFDFMQQRVLNHLLILPTPLKMIWVLVLLPNCSPLPVNCLLKSIDGCLLQMCVCFFFWDWIGFFSVFGRRFCVVFLWKAYQQQEREAAKLVKKQSMYTLLIMVVWAVFIVLPCLSPSWGIRRWNGLGKKLKFKMTKMMRHIDCNLIYRVWFFYYYVWSAVTVLRADMGFFVFDLKLQIVARKKDDRRVKRWTAQAEDDSDVILFIFFLSLN